MTFEILKGFPTDQNSPTAELHATHNGSVDIPAIIQRDHDGTLQICIYEREGEVAWTYPVDDWNTAVQRAVELLEER